MGVGAVKNGAWEVLKILGMLVLCVALPPVGLAVVFYSILREPFVVPVQMVDSAGNPILAQSAPARPARPARPVQNFVSSCANCRIGWRFKVTHCPSCGRVLGF